MIFGDVILWVNYWGIVSSHIVDLVEQYQYDTDADVIIDNIPSYFSVPREGVYNIYSCRKFLGVPEGGHIIGNMVKKESLPMKQSAERYIYLLKAVEQGSNAVYEKYQENEEQFTSEHVVYGMSELTRKIISGMNYESIVHRRKTNFEVLDKILGKANRLVFNKDIISPAVYPFLSKSNTLNERLVEDKIYVSRFWKHVLSNELSNSFERDLAGHLTPLPIDQRYTETDMEYIANRTLQLLREE